MFNPSCGYDPVENSDPAVIERLMAVAKKYGLQIGVVSEVASSPTPYVNEGMGD